MNVSRVDRMQAERLKRGHNAADEGLNRELSGLAGELGSEVRRTIEYFQVQNKGSVVNKVILTGGGAMLAGLPDMLSAKIGLPVMPHDLGTVVDIHPSIDYTYFNSLSGQLAVAVGLALRGGGQ